MNPETNPQSLPITELTKEAKTWGMLAHLSALAGYIIPFGNIIGPLIVWAIKKDESPFIADQGKESMNFQITMTIGYIISLILLIVVIGIFLLLALGVVNLIFIVIAAIKANDGVTYRYPFAFRFIN